MTELKMVYELVISRANPLDNCALNSIKSKTAVFVIHFIHNFTEIQNTTKGFQYQDNNIFLLVSNDLSLFNNTSYWCFSEVYIAYC